MYYSLEQENQFLKDQLTNTQKFLNAIKQNDEQGQIDQLIQSNNNFLQMNSQLNSMHKSVTGLEPGNYELQSLLREKEDEILKLRTQLTSAKDDIVVQLRNKVHSLQDDIKVKTQERNSLIQKTIDLTKQNEDLQGRLRNFEAYMSMVKTLNAQAGTVAHENENLKVQLEAINDSQNQSNAQNIQLKSDIIQLQQALSVQAQELNKSRTDLQHSEHACALLKNENTELRTKTQESHVKLVEYEETFNEMAKKISILENEKKQQLNNNKMLQDQIAQQQKLLQDSKNSIQQYQSNISQYTQLMVQMKQFIHEIQAQNQNLVSQREQAKLEYQQLMTSSTAEKSESEQIIQQLRQAMDFQKKYTQTVLEDYEVLKRKSKDVCTLNKQLSENYQSLKEENDNIANENDLLRTDLLQSSRQIDNNADALKALEASKITIRELEGREEQNRREKQQLRLLVDQLSQRLEYVMSQYSVLGNKIETQSKNNAQ